jgi:PAS domain S-box-containing protein
MASKDEFYNQLPLIGEHFDPAAIASDIASLRQLIEQVMPADTPICHQQDWVYTSEQYAFTGFLIGENVILYWVKGHVRKNDSEFVIRIMEDVIARAGGKAGLYQILDLSHIRSFSLAARKSYEQINKKLSPYWQKSYYIFSGIGNTIFKLYTAINPSIRNEVTLAESLHHALTLCQENSGRGALKPDPYFDPKKAKREDLLEKYLQLEKKYEALHHDQAAKANLLLKNIAQISWDENFEKTDFVLPQDDPFYNVFGALSLLRQDLGEIYDRQNKTNRILEAEVARRTRQLSSVIENTSDMIMSVDRDWKVQVVNTSFQQHFSVFQNSDIQVGDHLLSLYRDEGSLKYWKKRLERAFRGERFQEQVTIPVQDQKVYYELNYNPIRHPGKKEVTEVSVFGRNITALRQAEENAIENEKNLTRALQIARAGSWELNLRSGDLTIGKEGLQVIGYPDEQEIRLHIDDFIKDFLHPDDASRVKERLAYAFTQLGNSDFQDQFAYRLYHKDGTLLHLMLYSRFKAADEGIIYGITQDITQQKSDEEQLLEQNQALRKVNSELDHFVYSVSHDLRAPLASVLGLINISRQEKDISSLLHYLDLKEKSIKKLDAYIQEIIDLSKNARLEVASEPIDFRQLVEEVYESQNYDQSAHKIQKHLHVVQEQVFLSDYKRLRVVMQNLISNAHRYANFNQAAPYIRVSVLVQQNSARIEVEDNGIGIHAEYIPNIFDMFYRATQTRTGSGLGLYIVKETLSKLQAQIEVASEPGKGSKFTVFLPNKDT